MARATGSHTRTKDTQFMGNHAADERDPAPETDEISGTRADYAPTGADPKPTTGGTLKRTLKEFSEDNLSDWAAALTYYGVLALFPALLALLSIAGLLMDKATITDAVTAVVPGSAADTLTPVINQIASNSAAGFGLVLGVAGAIWSASGYVGAFTRAANVVYETPEGRKVWKLKPLQLLVTLIGILFAAVIVAMVALSGPVVEAIGGAIGLGDTALTVWNIAKWPVILVLLALMIAVLYYSTPNVKLRGFTWVSPGAGVAIVVAVVGSALFAFYVANFGSYNKTYGSLAGVIVFLVWFWLVNLALLFGIELDAEVERTKELKEGVPRAEKEIQLDARAEPKPQQTT
ncbi:MAG: putative ribonuclease [Blastococcus sp.]|jgi:membrane protein|nr:putative ribonuclease [Blastococcus sp.]